MLMLWIDPAMPYFALSPTPSASDNMLPTNISKEAGISQVSLKFLAESVS